MRFYGYNDDPQIMKGLVMESVTAEGDEMHLRSVCGREFWFWHEQDCCENVRIEDVVGDLRDLIGEPLLESEMVHEGEEGPEGWKNTDHWNNSWTWTFYKFATRKGAVTVRWYGTSNGYYSESVRFAEAREGSLH